MKRCEKVSYRFPVVFSFSLSFLLSAVESNPYFILELAYHKIFYTLLEENGEDLLEDVIQENLNKSGSVEEAFTFFKSKPFFRYPLGPSSSSFC
jgi:hypothetical protein